MKKSCNFIRRMFRMALIWAVAGALAGVLVETLNDLLPGGLPMSSLLDVWPPVLAVAGFLGGAVLFVVARLVGTRRLR